MRPEIKLFFDFEFTSLSPDSQPVSLGIVSEEIKADVPIDAIREFDNGSLQLKNHKILVDSGFGMKEFVSKSFYAEFSDFDLNRCDDWIKENVVSKLMTNSVAEKLGMSFENAKNAAKTSTNWSREYCILKSTEREIALVGNTWRIKEELKKWLSQFSDYNIQFVCDCGTFDWYWMLQLLAVWDMKRVTLCNGFMTSGYLAKIGLPKLPSNISPVPQDLNDLIALKKGISAREAFDLNREELAYLKIDLKGEDQCFGERVSGSLEIKRIKDEKHSALFDAKVIKAIYEKLS